MAEFFGTVPDAAGPPDSLPAVVPDFVGELVSTLGGAVGDARDGLGDVVTGGLEAVGMATLGETLILLGNLVVSQHMTEQLKQFSRRAYIATLGAATMGISALSGCLGDDDGTGVLATYVTDQPGDIADFESCIVTITGFWLGPEGAQAGDEEDTEPADRERYDLDETEQADLVQLQDGETQLIDTRELDVAEYEFLQLDISDIDATLTDGETAIVEVPGEAPLTFNESFEIREDTQTSFTADFTPVRRGQTEEYLLQPVPQGIQVSYEELEG